MQKFIFCLSLILTLGIATSCKYSKKQDSIDGGSPAEETTFLGQKPPGMTPQLFAPGIVSTDNLEISGVYDPNRNEFYFVRQVEGEPPKTYVMQYKDEKWQEPIVGDRMDGFISNDGNILYSGNTCRERTAFGWSDEKSLGPEYDSIPIMRLTVSEKGTYVFDERDSVGTIRYSRIINGEREKPKAFGNEINYGKWTAPSFHCTGRKLYYLGQ